MIPLAHVGGGVFEPLQIAALTLAGTALRVPRPHALAGGPAGPDVADPLLRGRAAARCGGVSLAARARERELLLGHMAQHLLIGDIGALLIVLGLTGPLLQPLLASRWLGWLRYLAHPLVALPLWAVNLHLAYPALYEGALASEPLHALNTPASVSGC